MDREDVNIAYGPTGAMTSTWKNSLTPIGLSSYPTTFVRIALNCVA